MQHIALLRGINVGGNNQVSMAELKVCFEQAGFTNVSTYINSGNVIFDSKLKSEASMVMKIEKGIEDTFGFSVRVVVRSASNIRKVAKAIPDSWTNEKAQKSDVLFLWDDYDSKQSLKLIEARDGVDTLIYVDGAILWNVPRKEYGKSGMNKFIGTELYKNMTARNINTVHKLASLVAA